MGLLLNSCGDNSSDYDDASQRKSSTKYPILECFFQNDSHFVKNNFEKKVAHAMSMQNRHTNRLHTLRDHIEHSKGSKIGSKVSGSEQKAY